LPTDNVLLDDRLLVAHLIGVDVVGRSRAALHTTTYWYYRACRAAVLGASGQLSGPFEGLQDEDHGRAMSAMLRLPDDIGLPDPRALVPAMVEISSRQPRLNRLNLEAVAAAHLLGARVLLSPPTTRGVLCPALDKEAITWDERDPLG
jgi:hypothetical protein